MEIKNYQFAIKGNKGYVKFFTYSIAERYLNRHRNILPSEAYIMDILDCK